ncbi:RNA N(6)-adenosine-methyltransferase mettl16-like [Babylonia areolata]|uniref:RNA N(6)-adenosine-methyltransferase mettl16-like n=1 Tax=Babylonia areolata TaxID=304850 RepID=UPI003FD0A750
MSLNKFMHPRNRYKIARPDFEALGKKYPEFKLHLVENTKGKPVLDFQDPEALRVLTICMLKEDYGFNIELPPDRLVPTLPLRLNYVHWIEDITKDWSKQDLNAIDIGTGACCVYPLLAISANTWRFLATEADDVNHSYAVKNVEDNNLTKRIQVVKVSPDTILEGAIGQAQETYDFCMCNPPFFADHFEAQGLVSRTPSRPEPKTMSTASPQEGIVQGGEVGFVRKMIEESNFLQDRVRVYTTMLGKKASLVPLKEILRRYKIMNFATTEFCQGKTMRWGLAWSFDNSITFPKSLFTQGKKEGKKSVVHVIPTQVGGRREHVYDLVIFFKQVFTELQIHFREGKQTKFFALLTLTAAENTWIHSRRKRRQMMREAVGKSTTEMPETSSQPDPPAAEPTLSAGSQCSGNSVSSDSIPQSDSSVNCGAATESTSVVEESCGAANDKESCSVANDKESCSAANNKESCSAANDKESATSNTAVREAHDSAENHNRTEVKVTDTMDTDQDQESLAGTTVAVQSDASADTENHKRKAETVTGESSDSPPAKRVKVESPTPSSETGNPTAKSEVVVAVDSSSGTPVKESPKPVEGADGTSTPVLSVGKETEQSTAEALSVEDGEGGRAKDRPPAQFVLKCHMSVRVQGSDLAVELTWLGGQDIQLMHQLMQVFKNRLAQRKAS